MSFPGYADSFNAAWWRVAVIIPPITEPVTLAQAKSFARIQYPDEDTYVVSPLISAAREYVETDQARALRTQVLTVYFMGFPNMGGWSNRAVRSLGLNPWWILGAQGIILLPRPPMQMVLSVQSVDAASGVLGPLAPSQYLWNNNSTPGRVMPVYGGIWPIARPQIDAVQVTYVAGYGATAAGASQSQTLAMQGFPTSGTFTLTFSGQTTAALDYDSTAAEIQTELLLLSTVDPLTTCAGGPFPVAPIEVTWGGTQSTGYQPLITATSTLTGTGTPSVLTCIAPLMPSSTQIGLMQILADSFENREATQSQELFVTATAQRMLMPERWGSYV